MFINITYCTFIIIYVYFIFTHTSFIITEYYTVDVVINLIHENAQNYGKILKWIWIDMISEANCDVYTYIIKMLWYEMFDLIKIKALKSTNCTNSLLPMSYLIMYASIQPNFFFRIVFIQKKISSFVISLVYLKKFFYLIIWLELVIELMEVDCDSFCKYNFFWLDLTTRGWILLIRNLSLWLMEI